MDNTHFSQQMIAGLNSIIISTDQPIRTTDLGGCIATLVCTEISTNTSLILTHYAPFSTDKHIAKLSSRLGTPLSQDGEEVIYRKAVIFFKRPDSNIDLIRTVLQTYCTHNIKLIQYSGFHEVVQGNVHHRSWRTKTREGQF